MKLGACLRDVEGYAHHKPLLIDVRSAVCTAVTRHDEGAWGSGVEGIGMKVGCGTMN